MPCVAYFGTRFFLVSSFVLVLILPAEVFFCFALQATVRVPVISGISSAITSSICRAKTFSPIFANQRYSSSSGGRYQPRGDQDELQVGGHVASVIKLNPNLCTPVNDMPFSSQVKSVLVAKGFSTMTPIQSQCYNCIFEGHDVIARSRTGTGKTFAFGIPIIEKVASSRRSHSRKSPSILILEPTRELACQVASELQSIAEVHRMRSLAIYGGSSFIPQIESLRSGVDIVVATPGRALDHISRGTLDLSEIEHVVLDEGDTMLEMGFQESVETIIANVRSPGRSSKRAAERLLSDTKKSSERDAPRPRMNEVAEFDSFYDRFEREIDRNENVEQADGPAPSKRECQFLLFSATMPAWIAQLVSKHMVKPVYMNAVSGNETRLSETITHYAMLLPPYQHKFADDVNGRRSQDERLSVISQILEDIIIAHNNGGQTIVFSNTREEVDKLSTLLANGHRKLRTLPLHGEVSQASRQHALEALKSKDIDAIVATDVAARGLDIAGVDLVVHCKAPLDVDTFVHRSGRTGRAGRSGKSILLHSAAERETLRKLESGLQFEFSSLGLPSNVHNRIRHVRDRLNSVSSEHASRFTGVAKQLIQDHVEKESEDLTVLVPLISKAVAAIAGGGHDRCWSKVTAQPGMITLRIQAMHEDGTTPQTTSQWKTLIQTILSKGFGIELDANYFDNNVFLAAKDVIVDENNDSPQLSNSKPKIALFDLPSKYWKGLLQEAIESEQYEEHVPKGVELSICGDILPTFLDPYGEPMPALDYKSPRYSRAGRESRDSREGSSRSDRWSNRNNDRRGGGGGGLFRDNEVLRDGRRWGSKNRGDSTGGSDRFLGGRNGDSSRNRY